MASNVQAGPVISPPVIIVLCIIVSVVLVIVVAATYRLCRQATGGADGNVEGQRWNPNKRPKEQVSYMERSQEVTAEQLLAVENPYREMLYESTLQESQQRGEPRPWTNLGQDKNSPPRLKDDGFEGTVLTRPEVAQVSNNME
ncbi:hypothetical protein H2198_007422 [Neophaeococcomyces mojaviensis]|uniref:Uncharacterized protein n=1 Tax=Neophaeococcomyces mojaviensis TaxID=3383035 RepID=A0ACC3A061_9EURO|nr:hypothetical protein H2198_007422 [Knufia sp. JES_112]